MVTHDPRDVSTIGDMVCLVERGRVVRFSRAGEIGTWGVGDADEEAKSAGTEVMA
jgi:ABC-type thiamine transport system ATPase subunit